MVHGTWYMVFSIWYNYIIMVLVGVKWLTYIEVGEEWKNFLRHNPWLAVVLFDLQGGLQREGGRRGGGG